MILNDIFFMQSYRIQKQKYTPLVFLPINKTQKYDWGSKHKESLVGSMTEEFHDTYAEFWMGIHPKGQSKINEQTSLKQYLKQNGIEQLQFLFKILSIEKCLSIQVHPNEQQAKELHSKYPQTYVDDKDKPELFLTLSDEFELFLGFISEQELDSLLQIQPFQTINKEISKKSHKENIIQILEKIVDLKENQLKKHIENLIENLDRFSGQRQSILRRIFDGFGFDTGVLVSCLLQYHSLEKGACFGIQAGVPHAYIRGQCFELMKSSDNVVRLGLTPKKKDIGNLLKIIENNFNKSYDKVESRKCSTIEFFEWKEYLIIKFGLEEGFEKIEIASNSIGISMTGRAQANLNCMDQLIEIPTKSVFFLQKGTYSFRGEGEIFFATKH